MGTVEEMWPATLPMINLHSGVTLFRVIRTVLKLVLLAPAACSLEPGAVLGPSDTLFPTISHPLGHRNPKALFLKACSSHQPYQNHPRNLLKYRFQGPAPRVGGDSLVMFGSQGLRTVVLKR